MSAFIRRYLDENLLFIWQTLMSPRARLLALGTLSCVLAGSLLVIVAPYAIGRYLEGLTKKELAALIAAGIFFVALEVGSLLTSLLRQQVREYFFQAQFWYLPQAISAKFFVRPLSGLTERDTEIDGGGVESLHNKVHSVTETYIFNIIPGYATVLFALVACTLASVWLGICVLVYITIERWYSFYTNAYIQRELEPVHTGFKRWRRRMTEWWDATPMIKYQGVETKILAQIHDEVQEALRGDDAVWRVYYARVILGRRLMTIVFACLLYGLLAVLVLHDHVALPSAVLVFFSFERVRVVLMDLSEQQREVQSNIASMAKYRQVLTHPVPYSYHEGTAFGGTDTGITFNKVSLSVADGEARRQILRNVSLTITPGERVGIVGPSGAGKSQLMSLLVRARDPDFGTVSVGGCDIRTVALESLLRYYGVIMQTSNPFEDTVLGNLLFGVSHLDAEHLSDKDTVCRLAYASLTKAGLDVSVFPQGLFTSIGFKGMRLSGGQQQRLQIAAAHFKLGLTKERPRLILADEPTSSLDSLSELTVMEHLQDNLPDGTTLLMVAHRLSTVANMDKIIFVRPLAACDQNTTQVTMHDSLSELYKSEALFREMADAQGFRP